MSWGVPRFSSLSYFAYQACFNTFFQSFVPFFEIVRTLSWLNLTTMHLPHRFSLLSSLEEMDQSLPHSVFQSRIWLQGTSTSRASPMVCSGLILVFLTWRPVMSGFQKLVQHLRWWSRLSSSSGRLPPRGRLEDYWEGYHHRRYLFRYWAGFFLILCVFSLAFLKPLRLQLEIVNFFVVIRCHKLEEG